MCTNPLKKAKDIDNIIRKLIKTKADTVIAVHKIEDHHPRRLKKIINDRLVDFMKEKRESRRQDLKPFAYVRSGSIYAVLIYMVLNLLSHTYSYYSLNNFFLKHKLNHF